MTELMEAVLNARVFLTVLVVFCIAPRTILRLLLRAYPPKSARREELTAEYEFVKRIERPLWVAEQFELALFNGLSERVRLARVGRAFALLAATSKSMQEIEARSDEWLLAARTWGRSDPRTKKAFDRVRNDILRYDAELATLDTVLKSLPVDPGSLAIARARLGDLVRSLERWAPLAPSPHRRLSS